MSELTGIAILVAMIANFSSINDKVFVAVVLAIGVSNFVGLVVFGQIEKRRELNEIVRRVREEEAAERKIGGW